MASKNTYDVVLEKVGNQPLMTTKILCGTLGLGLPVAKGMVDKSPTTVAKGLDSDKALALFKELESIGNIVSIPGMEMKTKSPVSDQNTDEQKETAAKKSAPSPSRVTTPKNDDFDAIFGGGTAQTTIQIKTTDGAESKPNATASKPIAAPNDEFDAIFGDSTPNDKD